MVDQIEFMLQWKKTLCRHTENNNDDWNDTYHNMIGTKYVVVQYMAKDSSTRSGAIRLK